MFTNIALVLGVIAAFTFSQGMLYVGNSNSIGTTTPPLNVILGI